MGKLLPQNNYVYQAPRLQTVGWLIMAAGMIVPGILTVINPSHWVYVSTLHQTLHVSPTVALAGGVVMILAGIASLVLESRDIPYMIATIFYGILALSSFIALCMGLNVGALFMLPVLVVWLYFVAMRFTSQRTVEHQDEETS